MDVRVLRHKLLSRRINNKRPAADPITIETGTGQDVTHEKVERNRFEFSVSDFFR